MPGFEMRLDEPEELPASGGAKSSDAMVGFFASLNIVDDLEVFSPPRVARQCEAIGFKAGSDVDVPTGWNVELKADRDRAMRQI